MNRESLKKVFDIVVMWAALTATSLVALWTGGMISAVWISLLIWCWESGPLAISVFTCVHIGAIWTAAVEGVLAESPRRNSSAPDGDRGPCKGGRKVV